MGSEGSKGYPEAFVTGAKEIGMSAISTTTQDNYLMFIKMNMRLSKSPTDRDTIFLPDIFTQTTTTNTVTVQQKYIPKFYKFCFWFVIIQLTAAAFFIAGYFLKFKFKLLNIGK